MMFPIPDLNSSSYLSSSAEDTSILKDLPYRPRSVWYGQEQSPLFGKIPAEIRNEIFWLALQEYDDPEHMYTQGTYYTRPGFLGKRRLEASLLRTCRRIWEETRDVIWQDLEITLFLSCPTVECPPEYNPPGYRDNNISMTRRCWRFTPAQWSHIRHARFISHCQALDRIAIFRIFSGHIPSLHFFRPESITLAFRYTDWPRWYTNEAPTLSFRWFYRVIFPTSVKVIRMEFETTQDKEKELDVLVEELRDPVTTWPFGREDGMEFFTSPNKQDIREWRWDGPIAFGDRHRFPHHRQGENMRYVVKMLAWTIDEALGVNPYTLKVVEMNEREIAESSL